MPLTPLAAQDLLRSIVPARLPVLLAGAPGVGKTAIVTALARELGYELVVSHPVTSDPTDYRGLPWMVDGEKMRSHPEIPGSVLTDRATP